MERILSKKEQEKEINEIFERKPWIDKIKGMRVIVLAALALAVLVAFQIIRGEGNWGQGILWGLIFGGSVFLVYFGMMAFHRWVNKDNDPDQKNK